MNSQVERSLGRLADEARDRYSAVLDGARDRTERAAGSVRKSKKPVQTLSKLGVNLSNLSHKTTAKVLKQQTKLVEHQIDALAGRLRTAAKAGSVRELLGDQLRLIPENAAQFAADTRSTLAIVVDAGSDVRGLLADTVTELRRGPARTVKAAKKKAKKKAKRAAKKTKSTVKAASKKLVDTVDNAKAA